MCGDQIDPGFLAYEDEKLMVSRIAAQRGHHFAQVNFRAAHTARYEE
jgi:hypothetical protein